MIQESQECMVEDSDDDFFDPEHSAADALRT